MANCRKARRHFLVLVWWENGTHDLIFIIHQRPANQSILRQSLTYNRSNHCNSAQEYMEQLDLCSDPGAFGLLQSMWRNLKNLRPLKTHRLHIGFYLPSTLIFGSNRITLFPFFGSGSPGSGRTHTILSLTKKESPSSDRHFDMSLFSRIRIAARGKSFRKALRSSSRMERCTGGSNIAGRNVCERYRIRLCSRLII